MMRKAKRGVRRARRADQKEERRAHILTVANAMLLARPYDKITMEQIARRSRLAKGTVYLYFRTKEELFLALQESELERWFVQVAANLRVSNRPIDIEQLSDLLVNALPREPHKMHLFASMNAVLEHNIEIDIATSFKRRLIGWVIETAKLITTRVPGLTEGQSAQLLFQLHAMIVGFWQLSSPPRVLETLYENPEFKPWKVEFLPALKTALVALLKGTRDS